MTDAEWNAIVEKWERCRNVLGTDGFNEIITALHEGRRLNREIERLREWQRRAMVVIECPSSDTIQDELKWVREEASKP